MSDDLDIEPASPDDEVQNYLDARWRESMRAARDLMESLRTVVPEFKGHLPEVAYNRLNSALGSATAAYGDLHQAGRHVIGEADYDDYLTAQTKRKLDD